MNTGTDVGGGGPLVIGVVSLVGSSLVDAVASVDELVVVVEVEVGDDVASSVVLVDITVVAAPLLLVSTPFEPSLPP